MFVNNILAAGALISFASAIPFHQHHKRDIVWETHVVKDVVTVPVTTTVWVHPGENIQRPQRTTHVYQTVTVQPQPAPSANNQPPAQSPAQPQAPQSPAPMIPSIPNTPQAPEPTPQQTQAPQQTPQQPAAPQQPPKQSPAPQPQQPAPAPAPSQPSGGGDAPNGNPFTGDITYYTPGLGSCGKTNTASDMIVALAADVMEEYPGNPNDNPNCGKSITISYGGVTQQATIEDTCPGCSGHSLDLTPALFEKFASLGTGRVSGVQWWFN